MKLPGVGGDAGGSDFSQLPGGLGDLAGAGGMAGLGKGAEHMWAFLDEMAERDPEEYKTYMKKQQQEARQAAEAAEAQRPKPVFAMRTSATPTAEQGQDDRASMLNINGLARRVVLISVCSSERVPGMAADGSVPIVVRDAVVDPKKAVVGWQALFNVEVTTRASKKSEREFRKDLLSLALQCIADKATKQGWALSPDAQEKRTLLKGDEAKQAHHYVCNTRRGPPVQGGAPAAAAPAASGGLDFGLGATATPAADEAAAGGLSGMGGDSTQTKAKQPKRSKPLIQEVKRKVAHTVRTTAEKVVVGVELPDRSSAAGIELDLSADARTLVLACGDDYEPLELALGAVVDADSVKARFDKKKRALKVTMLVVAAPAPDPAPIHSAGGRAAMPVQANHPATAAASASSSDVQTTNFLSSLSMLGGAMGGF